ncbi:MAG: NADH-quinone oxidoreductase subunit H [Polyangiaceae bacterium]
MPRTRLLAIALSWLCLLTLLLGCNGQSERPSLLNVVGAGPRELSSGDELEVVGTNFPEGKPATISFQGSLHRPGEPVEEDVEIVIAASSSSRNRISVVLDDATLAEFAGRGAKGAHTTFRGRVVAAFAPRASGAPPVTGSIEGVAVDFFPSDVPVSVTRELESEGQRAAELLGLEFDLKASGAGLLVKSVAEKSRAETAGVKPGDRLVGLDGLRLADVSDFVPAGRSQTAELEIVRGKLKDTLRRGIDVQGFRDTPPEDLLWAGVVVGVVCVALLAFLLPVASVIGWFERRVVQRSRALGRDARRVGVLGWLRGSIAGVFREEVLPGASSHAALRVVPYFLFLGTSAMFTVICFGHPLLEPELDLGALFLGTVTALVCTGLMLGGWRPRGRWSLFGGLGAALQTLSYEIPPLFSILVVVLMSGSVRIGDIVAAQGGKPWEWYVFDNPITFCMFLLFFVPALSEGSRAHAELPEADWELASPVSSKEPRAGTASGVALRFRSVKTRYLMFFAEWGHVFVMSGLGAALFLGGWQLPGVSRGLVTSSAGLGLLSALVFNLKAWALTLAVLWVRWALPRIRVDQLIGVVWKWFVPAALVGLGATLGWMNALKSPVFRVVQGGLSYVLFGFAVLVPVYLLLRVFAGLKDRHAELSVNPWL